MTEEFARSGGAAELPLPAKGFAELTDAIVAAPPGGLRGGFEAVL